MFSFGPASTSAFGAAAPAFGAAASTPAFGTAPAAGSTPSLFGAASGAATTTTFGQTAPGFGVAPSPFGGGVATPAFGGPSSASLFGGTSSPSLFGAGTTPSLFGGGGGTATSAFGFQGGAVGAASSLFGAAQPLALGGAQQVTALTTKDNRPITHSSKWDDLSPQTQQYLTELEKVVVQHREDCRQLDADPRLASASGASEQQQAMQAQARSLSQSISCLGSTVKADVEQVAALREAVLYLVRSAETALHTFKRAYAWREAAKASTPLASQDIAGPPVLPSQFLREAIAGFLDRLKQHHAAVAELEQVLMAGGGAGVHLRCGGSAGGHHADGLAALQGALTNVHDFLIHTAARLQALDDRVSAARDAFLARRRAAGDTSDPFAEEERRQHKRSEHQPRSPAAQAAALQAAQQSHARQQAYAGHTITTFGALPVSAVSPGGLFGTIQSSPGGAFGTPLFGQHQQRSAPTSRKPASSRRR